MDENNTAIGKNQHSVNLNGRRANQLQFLRFIAFCYIFLLHARDWNIFDYPIWHGALQSVSFFFVLSGVVTGYAGYGKEQKPKVKDIFRYVWKKYKSIFPVYFLVNIVGTLDSGLFSSLARYDFAEVSSYAIQLLKNLLLIQSWFPTDYLSFVGVGWFFSTIFFLYLFSIPGVYFLNNINKRGKKYCLGILLCIISFCTISFHYFVSTSSNIHYLQYIFPPARLGEYLIGMIIGFLIRQDMETAPQVKNRKVIFTILEIAALAVWFSVMYLPGGNWAERVVYWLVPNVLLLSVFTFGYGMVSKLFCCKQLVRLGDITVDCVLLHVMVQSMYRYFTGIISAGSIFTAIVPLFIIMLITLLIADLIHKK